MASSTITKEQVVEVLKTVYDPEIPVNVHDLGLIYDVDVDQSEVNVVMTLTSPSCPSAREIPASIESRVMKTLGASKCLVHIVWSPPWGPHLISPQGKKILGIGAEDGSQGADAGLDGDINPPER
ncbi:MAG TPA: iron-sulfur cluster assembly protein [Planctomycetota bacterium]|nr:iron-sulfur cluster assembly protein [Planctomycetota bacterium]